MRNVFHTGADSFICSRFYYAALRFALTSVLLIALGCSILKTRPVQDMSNTAAAIQAAKEVQADTLAPEMFRQANEWFFKAKQEYKFKNFKLARDYAKKARVFAEDAEYEAIRNGGNRGSGDSSGASNTSDSSADNSDSAPPPPKEDSIPQPTGTPADVYDQRKAEEEAAKNAAAQPSAPAPGPTDATTQGGYYPPNYPPNNGLTHPSTKPVPGPVPVH